MEPSCSVSTTKNNTKTAPIAPIESQSPPRGRKRPTRNSTKKAQTGSAGRIQMCSIQNI